jgi:hypothetical protein
MEYRDAAQIQRLIGLGRYTEAEAILIAAHAGRKAAGGEPFEEVLQLLASLFSAKGNRNLERAESYHLERERLRPDSLNKWMTAHFYLNTGQLRKAIDKVSEVHFAAREDDDEDSVVCDRHNYYSCVALKGQALIQLGSIPEAQSVIEELIALVRGNPVRVQLRSGMNVNPLAFGDEMDLMQAAIAIPELRPVAKELLELVTPRIREEEARERGRRYLSELKSLHSV